MKKGFTLVELLIVVVILVTLMSVVFRLGNIGGLSKERAVTISRLQKLENCISGYYAAFGSYPPVKLHGSRNIYYKLNNYGIQQTENEDPDTNTLSWDRVNAACKSQPLGMYFPFSSAYDDYIRDTAEELMKLHQSNDDAHKAYKDNPALANMTGNFNPNWINQERRASADWSNCQVFQFGLMSFLLPRFVVMMGNQRSEIYDDFAQWKDNNQCPCRFKDGVPYRNWNELNNELVTSSNSDRENENKWAIEALPSQAVTARWMPSLEKILSTEHKVELYGVVLTDPDNGAGNFSVANPNPMIHSAGDSQAGEGSGDGSTQYVLDGITCKDGWGHEFYYYCAPPYQSYRLWSAGPNGKTFPPWISEEEFKNDPTLQSNRATIQEWISDDILHMSN